MSREHALIAMLVTVGACGHPTPSAPRSDSTAVASHVDDSVIAARTAGAVAFADTARRTMATLLKHPESATFDSLVVVQPPKENGAWPALMACGRIGGKPGVGGRATMTPFVYRNRLTVFVLDEKNATAFAAVRAKGCGNPASTVLMAP